MARAVSAPRGSALAVGGGQTLAWVGIAAGALAAGVALRVGILGSRLGAIDGDEAVAGLMSLEVLNGEFPVFFWLSYYAGTLEAYLTAPLFALFGSSVLVLKLVPLALYTAAAGVTWRVGARAFGEAAGRAAGLLMWVWPPFFVFWTTKRSAYPTALLCATLVLLFALRLHDRPSRRDALLLGVAAGLGIWATPQTLFVTAPVVLWLVVRRPAVLRLAGIGTLGFLGGAAPWVAWNLTHGFKAVLPVSSVAGAETTYLGRLGDLFAIVLPEFLGLRLAYSQEWLVAAPVGAALAAVAVLAALVAAARAGRAGEPLLAILLAFPFLYAASSFTFFVDEPRYLTFLVPVAALLAGRALRRPWAAALALGLAVVVSAAYLARLEGSGLYPFLGQPADIGPLVELAEREDETRVLAS
jgi:4-amino-4-deoxy-L-arabinose transferase-like glycosyltransferase